MLTLSNEDITNIRTKTLRDFLQQGGYGCRKSRRAAKCLFEKLREINQATKDHYNLMMQNEIKPEDCRTLMQEMSAAGIEPDKATFNTLINHYIIADQKEHAKSILGEMYEKRMMPDKYTRIALNRDGTGLSKMRSVKLKQCIQEGIHGRKYAQTLFSRYMKSGVANVYLSNIMLQTCESPEDARLFLARMKEFKIDANEASYNTLINHYMRRGRVSEANAVVKEMQMKGISISNYTTRAIQRTAKDISRMSAASRRIK